MNLVLFAHPDSLGLRSQEHFVQMLLEAFERRGHRVALRRPAEVARKIVPRGPLAKWAGYVDQYLLFPRKMRASMRSDPVDTLYVFCDQALGPWVPNAVGRPHVIHCHDLLALRSALGDVPENPTALTGRIYQRYIRSGLRNARHFISISDKSRADLHRFGQVRPLVSEVVYNGLNHPYRPIAHELALATLRAAGLPADERGCVLHVGGGQWYKNTNGVVRLYAAYVRQRLDLGDVALPMWMVSPPPGPKLAAALAEVPRGGEVRFFQGLAAGQLEALYSFARALIFPSLAEGFGWPIVEAMACGCPVITTDEAPMTEVGGTAACYLPRLGHAGDIDAWARRGAETLTRLLQRSPEEQALAAGAGRERAARFSGEAAIDSYLSIYDRVLGLERTNAHGGLRP